jgi:hypothetical protein
LDLPLEEIRELAAVWDAGSCAPVQHRLTDLLTAKITEVDARVGELTAFRAQLVAARDGLGRHTPDGPCDDTCGCLTPTGAPASRPTPLPLTLRPTRLPPIEPGGAAAGAEPIACTLGAADQQTRIDDWARLLDSATGRDSVDGGIRLTLPADPDLIAHAARLAAQEQQCCRFFRFTIELSTNAVTLTVRAPAEARDLLDALFGAPW